MGSPDRRSGADYRSGHAGGSGLVICGDAENPNLAPPWVVLPISATLSISLPTAGCHDAFPQLSAERIRHHLHRLRPNRDGDCARDRQCCPSPRHRPEHDLGDLGSLEAGITNRRSILIRRLSGGRLTLFGPFSAHGHNGEAMFATVLTNLITEEPYPTAIRYAPLATSVCLAAFVFWTMLLRSTPNNDRTDES